MIMPVTFKTAQRADQIRRKLLLIVVRLLRWSRVGQLTLMGFSEQEGVIASRVINGLCLLYCWRGTYVACQKDGFAVKNVNFKSYLYLALWVGNTCFLRASELWLLSSAETTEPTVQLNLKIEFATLQAFLHYRWIDFRWADTMHTH